MNPHQIERTRRRAQKRGLNGYALAYPTARAVANIINPMRWEGLGEYRKYAKAGLGEKAVRWAGFEIARRRESREYWKQRGGGLPA